MIRPELVCTDRKQSRLLLVVSQTAAECEKEGVPEALRPHKVCYSAIHDAFLCPCMACYHTGSF